MDIKLESSAFENKGMIPRKFTCDGEDVSPPLSWQSVPESTESLTLICDDPDAPMGTWVHWVVYNLPPETRGLKENITPERDMPKGGVQGMNDFKKIGYGGPCPPGGTHRYFFKIYALDTKLELDSGATRNQVVDAMQGHILAQGDLMGKYSR